MRAFVITIFCVSWLDLLVSFCCLGWKEFPIKKEYKKVDYIARLFVSGAIASWAVYLVLR